jgi:hypothetical protein
MAKRKSTRKTATRARKSYRVYARAVKTTRRRRRGLSAGFTTAGIKSGLMDAAQGALGGILATFISNQKFMDSQSDTNKGLILTAASVVTGTYFKRPAIAAGMAAIAGTKLAAGLGAGSLVGLSEGYLPISEGVSPAALPYGLQDGMDYAGLSENVYQSSYANLY